MESDNEKKALDYGAFLADLEAKRLAIDRAISSLRALMASGALSVAVADSLPPMADSLSVSLRGGEIPVGAFLGKTIPEAAKLCLQIMKRKMTTKEIAEALLKGGIETTARTSFNAIVHSILRRTWKSQGGIVKFGRSHWGLPEWLPASMRSSSVGPKANAKGRKTPTRTSKRGGQKAGMNVQPSGESIPRKLWSALNKPGVELSAQEAAEMAGTKANVAAMLLAGLVKRGRAQRTPSGKYRVPQ